MSILLGLAPSRSSSLSGTGLGANEPDLSVRLSAFSLQFATIRRLAIRALTERKATRSRGWLAGGAARRMCPQALNQRVLPILSHP
jgi:hypothetical protein